MSKSAQLKEEQRAKIREKFLRDLFTEDNSEHGFSIFEEEEPKTKRYRSEVKNQPKKPKVIKVVEKKPEPKRYRSEVKIQLKKLKERPIRPIRKAPDIPKGVSPWKPRTAPPKARPIPLPRKKLQDVKPTPPPRIRKPVKQSKEVEEQPQVITPEEHEIDPFGTDLQMPGHRKIETAANGAAVTYSLTPSHNSTSYTAKNAQVDAILMKIKHD
jgi:hypothetical protein